MMTRLVVPTLILLAAASAAGAQSAGCPMMGPGRSGMMDHETMGAGGMKQGMPGPGLGMDRGMMGGPGAMRIMMILMDSDGDGALSLEEVQAVHARMFKAMDADGNGRLVVDEFQSFMQDGAAHQ